MEKNEFDNKLKINKRGCVIVETSFKNQWMFFINDIFYLLTPLFLFDDTDKFKTLKVYLTKQIEFSLSMIHESLRRLEFGL